MKDGEKLSPDALKIFETITRYYPPDSWGDPQWKEDGHVFDNGWKDLRIAKTRNELIHYYEYLVGTTIVTFSRTKVLKGETLDQSVFNLDMSRKWIELATYLYELDFQIGTMDLIEGATS